MQQATAHQGITASWPNALPPHKGCEKLDARKYGDSVLAAIAEALAKGDAISLNGFGMFRAKETPAREGRNPAIGATIQIAAARKLTSVIAKAVKDRLNG